VTEVAKSSLCTQTYLIVSVDHHIRRYSIRAPSIGEVLL
jgi:hypothetical protein